MRSFIFKYSKPFAFSKHVIQRHLSTAEYLDKIKKCYQILNIEENSDQETVRRAYLDLAKKYHPDSGSPEADIEKFQQIEVAFRILNKKKSQERWEVGIQQQVEEFDIKHTAPQHRQYLSYEGVGFGTPAQREKHWSKVRASRAAENVMEHRIAKATAAENTLMDKNAPSKHKHNIKTKYGFDRLVEDLIQESMSKGEFNNLRGSGKPLPLHQNTNPYVDFVTHKMNQVLIDNGFTPEWITLQKDISKEVEDLRSSLLSDRSKLGPLPLTPDEEDTWSEYICKYETICKQINSKINHYNLVVPILQKQKIFILLDKEAKRALEQGKDKYQVKHVNKIKTNRDNTDDNNSLMTMLVSMFKL